MSKPAGPPPGPPPVEPPKELFTKVKPPPMAPPPRNLAQTIKRPDIEDVKTIDPNRFVAKSPAAIPMRPKSGPGIAPRGPPPRAPPPMEAMDTMDDEQDWTSAQRRGAPPPKFANVTMKAIPQKKEGAINMFESPPPSASKKSAPLARVPRPLPPRAPPPGIPPNEPLPPGTEPPQVLKPPAPLKPPPQNRGRAPPPTDPDEEVDSPSKKPKIEPPKDVDPPYQKGVKKVKVEEVRVLARHEMEYPEYEESDDEADDRKKAEEKKRAEEEKEAAVKAAAVKAAAEAKEAAAAAKMAAVSSKRQLIRGESVKGDLVKDSSSADLDKQDSDAHLIKGESQLVMQNQPSQKDLQKSPSRGDLNKSLSKADLKKSTSRADLAKAPSSGAILSTQPSSKSLIAKEPEEEGKVDVVEEQKIEAEEEKEEHDEGHEMDPSKFHLRRALSSKIIDSKAPPVLETPAATAMPVNELAGFVPPPPVSVEQSNSKLASMTKGGRISVRCISGHNIKRKDDKSKNPRIDPFIKLRFGAAEKFPWKQTRVKRKQDANPRFDNEIVFFDVVDPAPYIYDDDIEMTIQVWNKATLRDELIGSVNISVVNFFLHPFISFEEKLPLIAPGARQASGDVVLEFVFEEARIGIFLFTLYEARALRNVNPMGKQHPFVQLSISNYIKKSKAVKDSPRDPYFAEEELLMWVDKENWVHDVKVALLDEEIQGENPIGLTNMCLLPYMNMKASDARDETFDLFHIPKGGTMEQAQGELVMKVQYLPAGVLTCRCVRAKGLVPNGKNGKVGKDDTVQLDSYACFTIDGQASKQVKRSAVDKDGGPDPVWDNDLKFDIVDQYIMDVQVFDQDLTGNDVLLGSAQVSLLPTFKSGLQNFWVTLKTKKEGGGIRESGDVNLILSFKGPPNVAFPQHRPGVDAFDDSLRIGGAVGEAKQIAKANNVGVVDSIDKPQVASHAPIGVQHDEVRPEFTEDEIKSAFRFIDLDKNNFIGAAEIRHILVCMGELITDDEIDMMISMVDLDGDGQISIDEFRTLVLHPNPGEIDVQKLIADKKMEELDKNLQLGKGKQTDIDQESYQRQKEIQMRESKKKLIVEFLRENEFGVETLKHSYGRYSEIPKENRLGGRVDFSQFCAVLKQEPVGENLRLFSLFDPERTGTVDFREFILTALNFVEVDREVRIRFIFLMFDEEKTGFISLAEVEQILRGNHIASLASVQRKAQTIMKQTGKVTNAINLNEFIVVTKKFPNILFPAVAHAKQIQK